MGIIDSKAYKYYNLRSLTFILSLVLFSVTGFLIARLTPLYDLKLTLYVSASAVGLVAIILAIYFLFVFKEPGNLLKKFIPSLIVLIISVAFILPFSYNKIISLIDLDKNFEYLVFEKSRDIVITDYKGDSKDVIIPNYVTQIRRDVFKNNDSITSITISKSVKLIEDEAFTYCKNLVSINVDSSNTRYSSIEGNLYNHDATELIQYANGQQCGTFTVPLSVENIKSFVFSRSPNLNEICFVKNIPPIQEELIVPELIRFIVPQESYLEYRKAFASNKDKIEVDAEGKLVIYFESEEKELTYLTIAANSLELPSGYLLPKTGYTFLGWFEKEKQESFDFNNIQKSARVFPKWKANDYTVTLNKQGGIGDGDIISTTYDSAMPSAVAPEMEGYEFLGYYDAAEGGKQYYNGLMKSMSSWDKAEDTTLYARWQVVTYNITYVLNDGTNDSSNPKTYTIESPLITLENPTRLGYSFVGWTDGNTIDERSIGDKSFTANWEIIIYDIAYDLKGGANNLDNPDIYTIESPLITLQEPSRLGYEFSGWIEGNSIALGSYGNKIFTASWEIIEYAITYELNGGINHPDNPTSYTIESPIITLQDASRLGYDFAGWIDGNSITLGSYGNKIFTASWEIIEYTITYELNGGTNNPSNPTKYTIESPTIILQAPEKTVGGFLIENFLGWTGTDLAEATINAIINTNLVGERNYIANWESTGNGTEQEPYRITTKEQMIAFSNQVNAGQKYTGVYFALGANIDLGGIQWVPIGSGTTRYFAGNFNGRGYAISNFNIIGKYSYAGLFGENRGTIQNLGIEDFVIDINSSSYVGGLVGWNGSGGSIMNSYAIGNISITSSSSVDVGGLVGYNGRTITGSYATVNISVTSSNSVDAGGLVGLNGRSITNSYATGNVSVSVNSSSNYAGGLVGSNNADGSITNSYAMGGVSANSSTSRAGGLVGYNSGSITNSYAIGNVSASSSLDYAYVGGLVGQIYYGSKPITNSYATGNVSATSSWRAYAAGFVGNNGGVIITNNYRYTGQTIYRKEGSSEFNTSSNTDGTVCSLSNLNSVSFFTATLGWDSDIWDFSKLNFINRKYPTLKNTSEQENFDTKFQFVSAGTAHSLAIDAEGNLWGWGNNSYGQLGEGTTSDKNIPMQINIDTKFRTVSAGVGHSLAIDIYGNLWAWGWNDFGQLGDGTKDSKYIRVQIKSGTKFQSVSAGLAHSLAIDVDGNLWAWGWNDFRQLGDGTTIDKNTPVQIKSVTKFRTVSAGAGHSLAIDIYGNLWAWGLNEFGQLGDGTTVDNSTPVQIKSGTEFQVVSAGERNSLAIDYDGNIWAWGRNHFGQLGDGTTVDKRTPVQITSGTKFQTIAASAYHGLAIDIDGNLWAWGNYNGQIGDGPDYDKSTPVQIELGIKFQTISAGQEHSLAIDLDGNLWAWGDNQYGQLGNGTNDNKNSPLQI